MISQGDILGMLHLRFPQNASPLSADIQPKSVQRLAIRIAQHITLALVNINLRESLKLQSILPAGTGERNLPSCSSIPPWMVPFKSGLTGA